MVKDSFLDCVQNCTLPFEFECSKCDYDFWAPAYMTDPAGIAHVTPRGNRWAGTERQLRSTKKGLPCDPQNIG